MAPTDKSDTWFFVSANAIEMQQEAAEKRANMKRCVLSLDKKE